MLYNVIYITLREFSYMLSFIGEKIFEIYVIIELKYA